MDMIKQHIAETFLELAEGLSSGRMAPKIKVAVTGMGSEHGQSNIFAAAKLAAQDDRIEVVYLGTYEDETAKGVVTVRCEDEDACLKTMEELLHTGAVQAAVAMHYPFPIGVSTVGRAICPAEGKEMFLANTTGTSSTDPVEALVLNTLAGLAAAKACGIENPTVGLLNLNAVRQAESVLKELQKAGYSFRFAESARKDGGAVLRGNDVLLGTPDVMVCDALTGNVLTKMLAAYTSGGTYETQGYGYGPGLGDNYKDLVLIISRASGAPLVANAIRYAAQLVEGNVIEKLQTEYKEARKAGLDALIKARKNSGNAAPREEVKPPAKEVVTSQISGIDVMDLEDAVHHLWRVGIYAEDGMGCTGPIVRVSEGNLEKAKQILIEAGILS